MDDLERLAREICEWPSGETKVIDLPPSLDRCAWAVGVSSWAISVLGHGFVYEGAWQAKRDELTGKPKEWVNGWARYRAQDLDGIWNEYDGKPVKHNPSQSWFSGRFSGEFGLVGKGEVLGNWQDTLEERVMEDNKPKHHEVSDKLRHVLKMNRDEMTGTVISYVQDAITYLERPSETEAADPESWSGEGPPPVGTVCEYSCVHYQAGKAAIEEGNWYRGTIIAYHDGFVWTSDNGLRKASNTRFRPVKSQEEREKEEQLNKMVVILAEMDRCSIISKANALYDEGCRIPDK